MTIFSPEHLQCSPERARCLRVQDEHGSEQVAVVVERTTLLRFGSHQAGELGSALEQQIRITHERGLPMLSAIREGFDYVVSTTHIERDRETADRAAFTAASAALIGTAHGHPCLVLPLLLAELHVFPFVRCQRDVRVWTSGELVDGAPGAPVSWLSSPFSNFHFSQHMSYYLERLALFDGV